MAGGKAKDILFIGDSLVEYFDWSGRFPAHRAANLGVSGENVEWLLERLERVTSMHPKADMIFVMTGINNVAMEETGFISEYGKLLKKLMAAYPRARVYANSLLPTLLPFLKPHAIQKVNLTLKTIAEETGATFLDIHSAFMASNLRELLLPDGVHLSEKGYELWSGIIEGVIEAS